MMQGPLKVVERALLVVAAVVVVVSSASADAFLNQANQAAAATPGTRAAEEVLFPALAAMEPSPSGGMELWDVMTLGEREQLWGELERWAAREPQQAALEALATVADPETRFVVGIGYDSAASAPESWREAGLVSSIGRGGELGTVGFEYVDKIISLTELALVEGYRLAREGDGQGSLDVLIDLVRFGRIMAERPSYYEKSVAMVMMNTALERIRDVVYSHEGSFTASMLKEAVIELDDRTLTLTRIAFPVFERLAAEQALERAFVERGNVRAPDLAEILMKSESGDRPLRAFSEFAWYETLAGQHAGWFDTRDRIQGVWGDFQARWNNQNWNAESLDLPTEYSMTDPSKFALVRYFGGFGSEVSYYTLLADLRFDLVTNLRGTYNALGVVAFKMENRAFPPVLAAIQPRYVSRLAQDPHRWNKTLNRQEDFGYFVPIRDQQFGPRELPGPYAVLVTVGEAEEGQEFLTPEMELEMESEALPMGSGMSLMGGGGAAGGGMGGGMDMTAMFAEGFGGDLGGLEPPADLFDAETGGLRVDALRRWLLESIETVPMSGEELEQTNQQMMMLAQMWTTPEAARQQANAMFAMFASAPEFREGLTGMGLDATELQGLVGDLFAELAGNSTVQGVLGRVRSGERLSEVDVRSMSKAMVEVAVQERYIEPFESLIGSFAGMMGGGGAGGETFVVMLDDSVFLLYSMGEDGRDGRAKVVGDRGADILIWPPLSSLHREHR